MFQDRGRLKKSKSEKRKRRYASSDSADDARKKPRKSKKSKKKPKKKPHKVSTSLTSSSYSSDHSISSCSSCEKRKSIRSRSPVSRGSGKSKLRKGRVSTSSKYKGRERGRSHRRSRRCSTCSSSSSAHSERSRSAGRSRSPKRSKRLRKDREKAEKEWVSRLVELDSEERDKVIPAYNDIIASSKDEDNQMQRGTTESELVADESEKVVPVKTQNDGMNKTGVVDAELILRQKALENFIKFHKVKKCGISEERGNFLDEPNEVGRVPGAMATDKEREEPTLDEPTKVINDMDMKGKGEIVSDISVKRPRLRSVIVVPTEMEEVSEDNTTIGTYNAGEISNGIKEVPKHVEDEPGKHVEEEPDKGSEPNHEAPDPSSLVATGLRKDEGQREPISGELETGGAQYKKKTFSRLHDGETVQVNLFACLDFSFLG